LKGVDKAEIKRVALSTTIVTNTLVEGKEDRAALFLLPGPGLNLAGLTPVEPVVLAGYTDHRGREAAAPERGEVKSVCQKFKKSAAGFQAAAVAGKFSVRNPAAELVVAEWVAEFLNPAHITVGSEISGTLNFLRRANSAYYNAAVWRTFQNFRAEIALALERRGLKAPVYVLKADGGTMPLATAAKLPVEAIFTGPAASVMGVMALAKLTEGQAVSLDIGGTTTDIALWQNQAPLLAPGGAKINAFPTVVRSFWLRSVGVGGDSYVRRENGELKVGPVRLGPAMALAGTSPTVFDAVRYLELSDYGSKEKAAQAMSLLAEKDEPLAAVAAQVVEKAASLIAAAIKEMLNEKQALPVYKVADIVKETQFYPDAIIGVGGAAKGLAEKVAQQFNIPCQIPPDALLANAVGAASAKPTTAVTLRADTTEGYYSVPELLLKKPLKRSYFDLKEAWDLAEKHLRERAAALHIPPEAANSTERVYEEEFSVIRGFQTMGKIITCKLQICPGILYQEGVRRNVQ
ncbi:MAG: hydantoinase/oxoprolinase family protein, partial [Sporomusaceae bacterium]|nr:hydantoinase/oxoprolinase family protein [Sporomusaceae bacterium]